MTPPRNAPCPCGSGRKYKKCCLAADQQAATVRLNQQRAQQEQRERERRALNQRGREQARALLRGDDDWLENERELLELSNGVVDLVRLERFDEAHAACQKLLDDYPDVIDGLERSATVHEAQGNHALAADFYQRCIDFIDRPEQRDGFDDDAIDYYRQKLRKLQQLTPSSHDSDHAP